MTRLAAAAVGPLDGTARFVATEESNLGQVTEGQGFKYFPVGRAWPQAMDVFRRERAAPSVA
jgi:hypothetical protein